MRQSHTFRTGRTPAERLIGRLHAACFRALESAPSKSRIRLTRSFGYLRTLRECPLVRNARGAHRGGLRAKDSGLGRSDIGTRGGREAELYTLPVTKRSFVTRWEPSIAIRIAMKSV